MALREFIDSSGVAWQVWEVHPKLTERRLIKAERGATRVSDERRLLDQPRFGPEQSLAHGWLAFRSSVERRRRSAIPESWEDLSSDGLQALLGASSLTGPVRRLMD